MAVFHAPSAPSLVGGGGMQYLASGGAPYLTTTERVEDGVAPAEETPASVHGAGMQLTGTHRPEPFASSPKVRRERFGSRPVIPVVGVSAPAVYMARSANPVSRVNRMGPHSFRHPSICQPASRLQQHS